MLRVEGVPQFEKEVFETSKLARADTICLMQKLHENMETEEFEDRNSMEDLVILEHTSPRELI